MSRFNARFRLLASLSVPKTHKPYDKQQNGGLYVSK